jgi:hypothetical protein
MKRAIFLALALVMGMATTARAAEFTKIDVAYNPYFGSLLIEVREQNIKPGTRVRIVISAAERFKYQCRNATDQKYFIHDHLVIDFEEHANDNGRYRAVFDVGPMWASGVSVDRCEGDDYPNLIQICYDAIAVLDIHREIGISWPYRECGKVLT